MISYLQAEKIARRIGDHLLFDQVSININAGDKIALIAVNGAGKSSLCDIIAGTEMPDEGSITMKRNLRISYLKQTPVLENSNSVIDELLSSENHMARVVRDYEKCVASGDHEALQSHIEKMDHLKAWDYEVAVKQILYKLKLTDLNASVNELSGGQKKRVALAKVLVAECDLLILDEPTNHLDLEMIEWLEDYLLKSTRTILMITHDRYFLERVCNVILELSEHELYRYEGNYGYFLEKKQLRESSARSNVEKARNLLRSELDWMRRMPKARRHKSKSRIDSFYDLKEKAVLPQDEKSVNLNLKAARMGRKILELNDISKSFGEKVILNGFSYRFNRFEKAGLVGRNGSGKTTLLNIITGLESPDTGIVEKGETIVFGYYRQQGIEFDNDKTVIEIVRDIAEKIVLGEGNELSVSQFLNYFLFPPEKHYTLVRKLSGGEKRRLYLLTILMKNPNFLILDEPTNDLDIITLNVLEDYLARFRGCVIIVSHDRFFMDKVVDHIFEFRGEGIIRDFTGNYSSLREKLADEERVAGALKQSLTDRKEGRPATLQEKPKKTGMSFREKQEFESLSAEIESLEKEKLLIESDLNEGITDSRILFEKSKRHGEIVNMLDLKGIRWFELSEKL